MPATALTALVMVAHDATFAGFVKLKEAVLLPEGLVVLFSAVPVRPVTAKELRVLLDKGHITRQAVLAVVGQVVNGLQSCLLGSARLSIRQWFFTPSHELVCLPVHAVYCTRFADGTSQQKRATAGEAQHLLWVPTACCLHNQMPVLACQGL